MMINLQDLIKSANGQLFGAPASELFSDFCFDVAQAGAGMLYVALRTPQGDTHPQIPEAIERGVAGVLCIEPPTSDTQGVTVVMARDTRDALMRWSHFVIGKLGIKVVAVAGTGGKSMAVNAIAAVLGIRYTVQSGVTEVDGVFAVPLSVARLKPETQFLVLRLNPATSGELTEMTQACQPRVVVVNHLQCDSAADCDQLFDEHVRLLETLSAQELVVLNFDDERARQLGHHTRARVQTTGVDSFGADALAYNVIVGLERTGFDLRWNEERFLGKWSPILGRHQLYGLLASVVIGAWFNVSAADGLKALTSLQPLSGRMNPIVGKNSAFVVDDTFRADPHATLAALDWLADVRAEGQRTILVIGEMDDTVATSLYGYRAIGARAAQVADVIITVGADTASVARAALDQQMPARNIHSAYSVRDAMQVMDTLGLNENDVVLVKGGSHTQLESLVFALLARDTDKAQLVRQEERGTFSADARVRTLHPSWIEVDTDAIAHNVRTIKAQLPASVALMTVVKANGYGHGAVKVARVALGNGATWLGVANMVEALELRDAGIDAPLLVMTYTPVHAVRQAIDNNITVTVFDANIAQQYDRAARYIGKKLMIHVKVDTGMGRLGVLANDIISMFRQLSALKSLHVTGVYTHFAAADEQEDYTRQQLETFKSVLRPLKASGMAFEHIHASNSPAALWLEDAQLTMVRTGLITYGLNPFEHQPLPLPLKPAMTWKTTVLQVKELPPNHSVGYGRIYMTQGRERVAILPVGYADGLRRAPTAWREVLINGVRAPIIGRVSMEKCAVNVSHIDGVASGTEVVLLGQQGSERITAEEVGGWFGTINYEVVTTILPRT